MKIMSVSSQDMRLRGRCGGFAKAAKYSPDQLTGAARKGFMARFTPTDTCLGEEERQRRARCALKAHMAKLARKSVLSRRRHAESGG
jgi:hypothetical protein